MKKPISLPRIEGRTSRQAHADLPEGTYERELGREGFFGPATHMYHRHPPTAWTRWDGPLRPRAFDLNRLERNGTSPFDAPLVLHNAHLRVSYWQPSAAMDRLVRNADGDWLLFVHAGEGDVFCDYGHIHVRAGDYLVLPRGTMWRIANEKAMALLLVEATNSGYSLPEKGLVGQHAIFDPAMLETPRIDDAFARQQGDDEWQVVIKRRGALSTLTYPFNPLDAVGWTGDLVPVRINVADIRPLSSHRYHVPPSAHTTFVANRFVVCTFAPRPFETDPGALKVPFFHNNDDFDEVIFYHAGDFFSRDNIDTGMLTFHPAGFPHGPHPKALARMFEQPEPTTDEYAVMLDARDALEAGDGMSGVEQTGYADSWRAS